MTDITVRLGGQKYLVSGEGRDATVCVEERLPAIGFRTIKWGSDLWRRVVKQADYQRAIAKTRGA